MPFRQRLLIAAGLAAGLIGAPAHAHTGADDDPIRVRMARGADSVRLTGVLRQGRPCCAYEFSAKAGQALEWSVSGPAVRTVIRYPDGAIDGPGLPDPIALPQGGVYRFSIHPNLMADGAYGRFVLRLTIRPLRPLAGR